MRRAPGSRWAARSAALGEMVHFRVNQKIQPAAYHLLTFPSVEVVRKIVPSLSRAQA